MIPFLRLFGVLLLLAVCLQPTAQAQISITTCGGQPVQNFNSLNNTVTNPPCADGQPWTNNTTILGWHISSSPMRTSNGMCATGGSYNFGVNGGNPVDRALGTIADGTVTNPRIGARFVNLTGQTINAVTIRYTGEQWRRATVANTLTFEFSTDATSLTTGTWTAVPGLNFTGPQVGGAIALNGTLPANQVTIQGNFPVVAFANGTEFWIRWNDTNDGGNNAGLAIDDFAISVGLTTPTPIATPVVNRTQTTVCNTGGGPIIYGVVNQADTYFWTVNPAGPVITGNPNATVTVNYTGVTPGTYTLTTRAARAGCLFSPNLDQIITVFGPSVGGTVSADATVCSDNTAFTVNLTGHTGSVVRWESTTDGFTTITTITNVTTSLSDAPTMTTQYRAVVQNGPCAIANSAPVTITVQNAPVAGTADALPNQVCLGDATVLSITGGTFTNWVWQEDIGCISAFTDIPFSNNVNPLNVTPTVAGTICYRAMLSTGLPCADIPTNTVTVDVGTPPVAGTVFIDQNVCESTSVVLSVTGHTGNVQWQEDPGCTGTFTDILGETTDFYFSPPLTQTTCYRTVISSPGCMSLVTNAVTITVDPLPNAGTFTVSSFAECLGNQVTLQLTGSIGNIQWQWDNGCTGNFTNVGNVNQNPYSIAPPAGSHCFRALLVSGVCPTAFSGVETVIISTPTVAGTASADNTNICGNNTVTFTLTGSQGQISWQEDPGCFGTFTDIFGANGTTYVTNTINQTTCFRAQLTSPGCPTGLSNVVTINVVPASNGGTIAQGDMTMCAPFGAFTLDLAGYVGNILRWESSVNNFMTVSNIANTTPQLTVTNLTRTTAYRAVVQNGTCPIAYSVPVTITYGVMPVAGILTRDHTICEGSQPNSMVLTGYAGTIDSWESSEDGFNTINVINHTSPVYRPGVITTTTSYRVLLGDPNCGFVYSNIVTAFVAARPAGTLYQDQTICNGTTATDLVLDLVNGNIVRWESSTDNFATITTINNPNTIYSPGALTRTTSYRVLLSNPGCANVYTNIVKIGVQNPPVPGVLSFNSLSGACSSNTGQLILTGSSGTIVRWEVSQDNFNTQIQTISNFTTLYNYNIGGTNQFRVVLQNAPCAIVYSNVVTVSASMRINATGLLECNGRGKIVALASGGNPGYTYYIVPNGGMQISPGVFTNLTPNTYTVYARDKNNCTAQMTVKIPTVVSAPIITSIQGTGEGAVLVTWDHVAPNPPNVAYQVRYREVGAISWIALPRTNLNAQPITGLLNDRDYQVSVRVLCVSRNVWSTYSTPITFRAGGMREGNEALSVISPELTLFPNPNKGIFNLRIGNYNGQSAEAEIFDLNGKRIHQTGIHSEETSIQLNDVPAGVYVLRIRLEGQIYHSKFIVE